MSKLSEHERLMILTVLGETIKTILGGLEAGMMDTIRGEILVSQAWSACNQCLNDGMSVEWFSDECRRLLKGD